MTHPPRLWDHKTRIAGALPDRQSARSSIRASLVSRGQRALRSDRTASNRSGAGFGSQGAVKCSPTHASLYPSSSAHCRTSRSHCVPSYKLRSGGCDGIMNSPTCISVSSRPRATGPRGFGSVPSARPHGCVPPAAPQPRPMPLARESTTFAPGALGNRRGHDPPQIRPVLPRMRARRGGPAPAAPRRSRIASHSRIRTTPAPCNRSSATPPIHSPTLTPRALRSPVGGMAQRPQRRGGAASRVTAASERHRRHATAPRGDPDPPFGPSHSVRYDRRWRGGRAPAAHAANN